MRLAPLGADATLLFHGVEGPGRAATTHAWAAYFRARFPGVRVVPGAGNVLVGVPLSAMPRDVPAAPAPAPRDDTPPAMLPVVYDGEDLEEVARATGLAVQDVVERHARAEYVVELLGFLPGFAYLAGLPHELHLPRRSQPRARVPAGSVAMAGEMSGVYPAESPGGWHLLGRHVGPRMFDAARASPALLRAGQRVRFHPVDSGVMAASLHVPVNTPAQPVLRVERTLGPVTVQDLGRPLAPMSGVPVGGCMDALLLAESNLALGNAASAPAVEVFMGALRVRALAPVRVCVDGGAARSLATGEELEVTPVGQRAVAVLAVEGGVDVPEVLGGRGTVLAAGLGGLEGRMLRRGDVLGMGDGNFGSARVVHARGDVLALRVEDGPHADRFDEDAWHALLNTAWQVSPLSNRVGTRLEGGRIPRRGADSALPVPMVRGAIQVTTDGTPVVLGPEHPVTGGYPVLGVLDAPSQAALAQARPRAPVRLFRR